MAFLLVENCKFYRDEDLVEGEQILIEDGVISHIGHSIEVPSGHEVYDAKGQLIVPGFVDLQVNGGGAYFFNEDVTAEALVKIYDAHSVEGTRFMLPTLITSHLDKILKAIEAVGEAMKIEPGILGMHLEGPFLNKEKKGAHNINIIRKPTDEELDQICEKGIGILKFLTIAPENFTKTQIEKLVNAGISLSAGHSMATYEQGTAAFDAGVTNATHLYNAMSPYTSREPGLVGATMNHPNAYAGIIVDGIHCHYASVEMAYKLKQGKLYLVSDASYTGILDAKDINFEGRIVNQVDGQFYTEDGSLAGSAITMHQALVNTVKHVNVPVDKAIDMATSIPAKAAKLDKVGSIEVGNSGMLNVLNDDLKLTDMLCSKHSKVMA